MATKDRPEWDGGKVNLTQRTDYIADRDTLYKVETAIISGSLAVTPTTKLIIQGCSGAVGQYCRILEWHLAATVEMNPHFLSSDSDGPPTALTGPIWLNANAFSVHGAYSPVGHFDTLSGHGLMLKHSTVPAAGLIGGYVKYIKI